MMSSVLRTIVCGMMIVISSSMIKSPVSAASDENVSSRSVRTSHTHERSVRKVVSHKKYSHRQSYKKSELKGSRYHRGHRRERYVSREGTAQGDDLEDHFIKVRSDRGSYKDTPSHYRNRKAARCCVSSSRVHKYSKAGQHRSIAHREARSGLSLKDRRSVYRKTAHSRKTSKSHEHAAKSAISGRSQYSSLIAKHANAMGVPVKLAHAVVSIESNFRATTRGAAGEVGLMQIKPATARAMGFRGATTALYDPDTNIRYGMKYLAGAYKMSGGSLCGTILRYNAGHYAKRMNPISARYCSKAKRIIGQSQDL